MAAPHAGEPWREEASRQRRAFEAEVPTAAARVFRDLGNGRTWRKKLGWITSELWARAPGGRFLELGAGELVWADAAAAYPARHIALDPAVSALARTRARRSAAGDEPGGAPGAGYAAQFAAGLAEELPFRDACFDGAFGIDMLHHVADPARAFTELARVLRPGAGIAFVEPNPLFPLNLCVAFSKIERGIFRITRGNLDRWARAAGLECLAVDNLPVFFPSLPAALAPLYELLERGLDRVPGLRAVSTGRTIRAAKPPPR